MSKTFVVTGTDTDVGKTVACAMLVQALGADYFKPVQAGLEGETDSEAVKRLSGADESRIIPELYRLSTPASPHYAAAMDGVEIDVASLELPETDNTLIVEGAGGLMVPLSDEELLIHAFDDWSCPTILCARTSLGTINHSLLSLYQMESHLVLAHGIIFIGDANPVTEATICKFGQVKRLGRIPILEDLSAESLQAVFDAEFDINDFQ